MADSHPTIRDLLGRDLTRLEEALAIYLIRAGHRWEAEDILRGDHHQLPSPIRAAYHLADVIVAGYDDLDARHQDAIRSEIRRLLWRIPGRRVQGTWAEAAQAILREDSPDLVR